MSHDSRKVVDQRRQLTTSFWSDNVEVKSSGWLFGKGGTPHTSVQAGIFWLKNIKQARRASTTWLSISLTTYCLSYNHTVNLVFDNLKRTFCTRQRKITTTSNQGTYCLVNHNFEGFCLFSLQRKDFPPNSYFGLCSSGVSSSGLDFSAVRFL